MSREPRTPGRTLLPLLLLAAAAAAYLPSLGAGFIAYDDLEAVVENGPVGGRDGGLAAIWTRPVFHSWLPVYYTSLRIDHALFGTDHPAGYRIENLLLHLLNAFLVLWLVGRATGRRDLAWLTAFLFAVHPAATESVAWISERKGLLAFLFSALAGLCFLGAAAREGRGRLLGHLAGTALLALALLAKGTALVTPLLLAVWVFALRYRERRFRWLLDLAPYLAVTIALTTIHYLVALAEGPAREVPSHPLGALLLTDLVLLAKYLGLLFFPFRGQSIVHDPALATGLSGRVLLGGAVVLLLAGALVSTRKRRPGVFFALAAVVVALLPFNNVLPRTSVLFAERYLYFPLFGASLLLGTLLLAAPRRTRYPAAVVAVALLFAATVHRAAVWGDPVELFADAERKAPDRWLPAMKHGDALALAARRGSPELWPEAARAFERAAARAGDEVEAARARLDEAAARGKGEGGGKAVLAILDPLAARLSRLPPKLGVRILLARGEALAGLSRHEEAVEAFRAAARLASRDPEPLVMLSSSLAREGDVEGARDAAREAVRLAPGSEAAAVVLAQAAIRAGDTGEARRVLEALLARKPGALEARCVLAEIELRAVRPAVAERQLSRVLATAPGHVLATRLMAEAEMLLARAALSNGNRGEAASRAVHARELCPDRPDPWVLLAGLASDEETADRLLAKAASLPGGEGARAPLAARRLKVALARLRAGDEEGAERKVGHALAAGSGELGLASDVRIRAVLPELRGLATDALPGRRPLFLGVLHFLAGEWAPAEERFTGAYRKATESGDARSVARVALALRGRARLAAGDRAGALDDFRVLEEMSPRDPWPPLRVAEVLQVGAVEAQNRAVKEGAKTDAAVLFKGARSAALRALALAPRFLEAKLRLGEIALASRDYLGASKLFTEAGREHPRRVEPLLCLADLYRLQYAETEKSVFLEGARKALEKVLALEPRHSRARAALGEVMLSSGRIRRAAEELARAIADDPTQNSARRTLAALFVKSGRAQLEQGGADGRKEAERLARRALVLDDHGAGPYLLLMDLALARKDYRLARKNLDLARQREPGSDAVKDAEATYHRDLGYAYLLSGRTKEERARGRKRSREEFRKAVAAGSKNVDLSEVKDLLGLGEKAPPPEDLPEEVRKILEKRTEQARKAFLEGRERQRKGDLEGAVEAFRRSIAARSVAETWYSLGLVREKLGQGDEAERAYRRAVAIRSSLWQAWLALGNLLYARGDLRGAFDAYGRFAKTGAERAPEEVRGRVRARIEELRGHLDAGKK